MLEEACPSPSQTWEPCETYIGSNKLAYTVPLIPRDKLLAVWINPDIKDRRSSGEADILPKLHKEPLAVDQLL